MTTIIIKNSSTASAAPVAGDLTKGELAVNVTDKKLYTKDNGGSVVKLVGSLGNQEASAVAITGGTIDGTPIGGTTASTASFTTVSASGNVTLSGGTANGVLYLNGSKVATSGSALTFDGTNFGVGASPLSGVKAYFATQSGNNTVRLDCAPGGSYISDLTFGAYGFSAVAGLRFEDSNALLRMYGDATRVLAFNANGSEQMRVTSTGLGIGTSSPGYKLDVSGGDIRVTSASSPSVLVNNTSASGKNYRLVSADSGNFIIQNTGIADLVYLNTSGNLGLGVTPSAWDTTLKAIQVNTKGVFASETNAVHVMTNVYYNSGYKYIGTGYATDYVQYLGEHVWRTAASGTVGNAISFTQAMTLDASGNLGVGTTSPATYGKLAVESGANAIVARSGSSSFCEINVQSGSADAVKGQFQAIEGSTNKVIIGARTNHPLAFNTNDTERARIDSSGNLLVGTTNTDPSGGNALGTAIGNASGGYISVSRASQVAGTFNLQNTTGDLLRFNYNGGVVGTVGITTTSTSYNTSSDYRLKENQQPLTDSGAFIDALQPKTWDWKTDGSKGVGFIAHEVQAVSPNSVVGVKDAVDEEGKPIYQAMEYGSAEFIANIIAELQSLRARVAQLESN